MNDYTRTTNADNENIKTISADVSKDNRELFRRALAEGLSGNIDKTLKECEDIELPPKKCRRTE